MHLTNHPLQKTVWTVEHKALKVQEVCGLDTCSGSNLYAIKRSLPDSFSSYSAQVLFWVLERELSLESTFLTHPVSSCDHPTFTITPSKVSDYGRSHGNQQGKFASR